jgi:hypothetical protein
MKQVPHPPSAVPASGPLSRKRERGKARRACHARVRRASSKRQLEREPHRLRLLDSRVRGNDTSFHATNRLVSECLPSINW